MATNTSPGKPLVLTDGRASWGVEVSTLRSAAPSGTQSAWHASSCWVVGEIYVGGAGVCPRLFKPVRSSQRNVSLSIPLYLTALELTNLLACIKTGDLGRWLQDRTIRSLERGWSHEEPRCHVLAAGERRNHSNTICDGTLSAVNSALSTSIEILLAIAI